MSRKHYSDPINIVQPPTPSANMDDYKKWIYVNDLQRKLLIQLDRHESIHNINVHGYQYTTIDSATNPIKTRLEIVKRDLPHPDNRRRANFLIINGLTNIIINKIVITPKTDIFIIHYFINYLLQQSRNNIINSAKISFGRDSNQNRIINITFKTPNKHDLHLNNLITNLDYYYYWTSEAQLNEAESHIDRKHTYAPVRHNIARFLHGEYSNKLGSFGIYNLNTKPPKSKPKSA